ncbi:hypothetical protein [Nitrosomonas sp. Nm166]|uniref:hypothetical protein n=1 Tax=Nitrosomonas sp. Nm166 TaxID=1881054 RepID=UPI0008E77525|nr:hypothetical protein [Nitrosomonas sp. Nm166]SFF17586.1 hypothetical protein SAMN05428977_10643 [Nitrosomonas sp. Nm166]
MVWSGVALFIVALATIWFSIKIGWNQKEKILVPSILTIMALALALPPLAIEAYPETYKNHPFHLMLFQFLTAPCYLPSIAPVAMIRKAKVMESKQIHYQQHYQQHQQIY